MGTYPSFRSNIGFCHVFFKAAGIVVLQRETRFDLLSHIGSSRVVFGRVTVHCTYPVNIRSGTCVSWLGLLSLGNGEVFPRRFLPLVGQHVKDVVSALIRRPQPCIQVNLCLHILMRYA